MAKVLRFYARPWVSLSTSGLSDKKRSQFLRDAATYFDIMRAVATQADIVLIVDAETLPQPAAILQNGVFEVSGWDNAEDLEALRLFIATLPRFESQFAAAADSDEPPKN